MPDELLSSFLLVFSFGNILAVLLGVIFGVFMGAVPGLTGTMGLALIIPLTYTLDPVAAFCILLGCYKGCLFSGSIPAILINTPGTPAAAATVLDGYPLCQQGQAGKALGMALWSSVIGDFISMIALVFGALALASMATKFGPPEYSMLILFSLTIVAGVSGDSLTKGLIAAGFGFLFGTVGLDPMTATPRFTFGAVTMMNGISLMAMLIGLFAMSEILIQAQSQHARATLTAAISQAKISLNDLKQCARTIFRGSMIGIILGSIPGLGATPAAFLSYSEAKRKSKRPERFGKGSLEGVAATESANNATCGGALIPLMALGVPGDVTTAVLLGAFLIHGLAPGPVLFEENLGLVYAIFSALFLAVILLPFVGLVAVRIFSRILKIPKSILFPVIALLCALGIYSFNSSFADVWTMLIFGVVGFVMRKLDFPLAPMMVGFVLEPIGERSVRQALTLSSGNPGIFFSTPISILFSGLTLASLTYISFNSYKKIKQAKKS
ncbi:MAG: C4-dicarboxylate ABC transporter permease [Candidatus Nitrohelix vancouverensis]|uniref:C4-dicarboxylate ABC transporter permease n=1 Tax=Candidatus Nitrohelix vancouverensis TaxID=2705534 RepID=A0A7T0G2I0_9BACT|nr:MAG: C4-dicarboxylate ABC transporter permease [Candidatus Nitrohelix vancouverensis]